MPARLAAFALLLGLSALARAQPAAPGYYRVSGISAGDVLNVRAEPGVGHRKVAALAPGASPLEVVEVRTVQGAPWGLIATGEGAGWVSMRYVERIELERLADTEVPARATCAGNEPFWGVTFDGDTVVLEDPEAPRATLLPIEAAAPASGRLDPVLLSFADDRGYALIERGICSDGMSDIPHGWSLHLILDDGADAGPGPRFLSGCCRVRTDPPRNTR
ncbi:MAG: hypothetical protein JXB36_17225 [Gammaproteobacteria bacterium]|nr:hypothetical protein [Gammaproteobacteria bacterium]